MSKICEICGKGYLRGHLVSRGIGRRVTRRTIHHQMPNLRSKKIVIEGTPVRIMVCASCLKWMKKGKPDQEEVK